MKRRFVLAITLLGALSATALAWAANSVITIPLAPPPKPKAEETKPPKPDKKTTTVAVAPAAEPMSPQAIVTIPPPTFSTEPLFAPGLDLGEDAFPTPSMDPALIEGRAVETKEVEPAAVEKSEGKAGGKATTGAAADAPIRSAAAHAATKALAPGPQRTNGAAPAETARPLRRGEMEPIDDYRPPKPPSVVINSTALDRTPAAVEREGRANAHPATEARRAKAESGSKNLGQGRDGADRRCARPKGAQDQAGRGLDLPLLRARRDGLLRPHAHPLLQQGAEQAELLRRRHRPAHFRVGACRRASPPCKPANPQPSPSPPKPTSTRRTAPPPTAAA